ncbi:TPA: flavin reductase family protein [Staphylococcus aureus]
MYTFDAQSLTARENYKLLIGSIIPRPIAFVTTLNQDASVNAAPLAYGDSELSRTELSLLTSTTIKTPGIKDAKMRFECKLSQMILLGDVLDGADLIIGEIVTYHIDDSIYEGDFKINPHALQAVSRLAGNDYAKLGGIFTIKRPEK